MTTVSGHSRGLSAWQAFDGSFALHPVREILTLDGEMKTTLQPDYLTMSWPTLKWFICWPCMQVYKADVHVCQTNHHPGDVNVIWVWQ